MFSIGLAALYFLATIASSQAQTLQCIETNGTKFIQLPNLSGGNGGMDVKDSRNGIVLADDFYCNTTGPITDIHLWGSWLSDNHGLITNFWIGIYSDVPAVIGPVGQIPSHPGTLLWWTNFPQGQYAETINEPPGSEYFYNPTNNVIVGGDNQAWYYCFYPANPFKQQGTANNPTNYWLAVRAEIYDPTNLFGWKTSISKYNDAAVWGTVDATGLPSGNWQSMTNPITQQQIDLSFKLTTPTNSTPPPTQCVETNGVKYAQLPNLDGGLDVWNDGPWMLGDDFVCTNSGPITDIHIWGSWLNNQVGTNTLTFWLAIYDDVPINATNNFSHPGNLLWQQWFAPGQYAENLYGSGSEQFLDPGPPAIIGSDQQAWYYCFYPTNPLVQLGTAAAPKTYWLAAYAQSPAGSSFQYGWKTTQFVKNDVSVHAPWPGTPPAGNPGWSTTLQTPSGPPLDLAFKITTPTNTQPPTQCIETNGVKTIQGPNTLGGYDVWNTPYVLADDFVCNFRGPVTDIHLWGSWLSDQALTGSIIFWLGIYDDVPVGPGNTFSHPGTNLLWQQWFAPGQYAETIWTANAQEQFLDPGQPPTSGPSIIGSDSVVWYYCFYPTNPFAQLGTATAPKTYWLAAYAQLPVGIADRYGWKTTTNVLHDISVHAPWPGIAPTNNPGWTPTMLPTGAPLDLAFKLTTPTNICGGPTITYLSTNAEVLTWSSGYLQSSTNVIGPYADVPGATSPYTNTAVVPPYQFYRLRCY